MGTDAGRRGILGALGAGMPGGREQPGWRRQEVAGSRDPEGDANP